MSNKEQRPEWAPADNSTAFASKVLKGVEGGHDGMQYQEDHSNHHEKNKHKTTIDDAVSGILNGDKKLLARAITLVESNAQKHINKAQTLLNKLLPHTGGSLRIGITGVPGAGKSTLIESLGYYLCERDHKVAVLAVDPSSNITGGSILGDKTRMERLSRHPNAYVRPSPSGGTLGGVTRKTRESILLCEAAGFDVIIVETIGVGQSEVVVRSMVDLFGLVVLTGAGDDLQGMKKGVMELADLLLVNKADGKNKRAALTAKEEYNQMLHYIRPATEGWESKALTCSALYDQGIEEIWKQMCEFKLNTSESGALERRRQSQTKDWIYAMIKDTLESRFFNHPTVREVMPEVENSVLNGEEPVTQAVQKLFAMYEEKK